MKLQRFFKAAVCAASLTGAGSALAASYAFVIDTGKVTVTPVFCAPGTCETQTGSLSGSFVAELDGQTIRFSNTEITSSVEGFELPANPEEDSGGTVRDISFSFDGTQLTVDGTINSSAFDGPIIDYAFSATVTDEVAFDPHGFYFAQADWRKCASPMCGGVFLRAANQRAMRCADGRYARQCYIGTVAWDAVGDNPLSGTDKVLVQGSLSATDDGFGELTVTNAYRTSGEGRAFNRLYAVQNNGTVCITSPCFSYDQYLLNTKRSKALSQVNIEGANADKSDIEQAYRLLAEGEVVIASGYNRRTREMAGLGRLFVATELYLPVKPAVLEPVCPEGYTETDAGCATQHGCFYPELEQTTIGGAAIEDPLTGELIANISYSCVAACEFPAEVTSPGHCTLALP